MFLILGLGNPGEEYRDTRHNVGYMVVDRMARDLGIPLEQTAFKALFGRGKVGSEDILLAKPLTFVNLSGGSAKALLDGFEITFFNLLVIHDDLDLPLSTIRVKMGGRSGGHRGLESIIEHLGTNEFGRIRIGIGHPPGRQDPATYVLRPFTRRQWREMDVAVGRAIDAILVVVREGYQKAMSEYNRS